MSSTSPGGLELPRRHPDTGGVELAYPLDRDDARVQAAHEAEARAYDHYELDPREHLVDVPDLATRVRVLEVGSGPPVVLVPGGLGFGVNWIPFLPEFDGYTAYVVDRPGAGLSDGIDHRTYELRTIAARSTAAVFDGLGLDEAPLVGNSMGGLWSLRFAIADPDRVSALALLGCPALFPGTSAPLPMRLLSMPVLGGLLLEAVLKPDDVDAARESLSFTGHPRSTIERQPDVLVEAAFRMSRLPHARRSWLSLLRQALRLRGPDPRAAFSPDDLRAVDAPAVLVWGSDDPFGTVEAGRAGAAHFDRASFHEVGVGHFPWFDEPETVGELVRTTLDRHRQ